MKNYKSKGFFKKQFDLSLNEKKTHYAFDGMEIKDEINKIRKKLRENLRKYFFYYNEKDNILKVSEKNQDILDTAKITIEVIKPSNTFLRKAFHQYLSFHGDINEQCVIELPPLPENTNRQSTIITNGFIDYEGIIYPSGYAEFLARNELNADEMKYSYYSQMFYPNDFFIKKNTTIPSGTEL